MTRRDWIAALLIGLLSGGYAVYAADGLTGTARVQKHSTYDFAGVEFYELRFSDGSAWTVSVDGKTKAAQALTTFDGKRVRVTIEPEPERLTR